MYLCVDGGYYVAMNGEPAALSFTVCVWTIKTLHAPHSSALLLRPLSTQTVRLKGSGPLLFVLVRGSVHARVSVGGMNDLEWRLQPQRTTENSK